MRRNSDLMKASLILESLYLEKCVGLCEVVGLKSKVFFQTAAAFWVFLSVAVVLMSGFQCDHFTRIFFLPARSMFHLFPFTLWIDFPLPPTALCAHVLKSSSASAALKGLRNPLMKYIPGPFLVVSFPAPVLSHWLFLPKLNLFI